MRIIAPLALAVATLLPATLASQDSTAPETGRLNIVSQSGVEVIWEGVSLGTTDTAGLLVVEGIPPGSYELLLRKDGYQDRESAVEVVAGVQSVRMQLPRPPPPEKASEPPREPEPPPGPAVRAPVPTQTSEPVARVALVTDNPVPEPETPAEIPAETPEETPDPLGLAIESNSPVSRETQSRVPEPRPAETTPDSEALALAGQGFSLSPAVYFLGLALLGTTGALVYQWRQRSRARAAFLAQSSTPIFDSSRTEAESVSFLGDLKRREVAIENLFDAGYGRGRSEAIDVEVEVVDLGPVEDED